METFGCLISATIAFYHHVTVQRLEQACRDYKLMMWESMACARGLQIWKPSRDRDRVRLGVENRKRHAEKQEKLAFYASLILGQIVPAVLLLHDVYLNGRLY